jgi:hypothetical protein
MNTLKDTGKQLPVAERRKKRKPSRERRRKGKKKNRHYCTVGREEKLQCCVRDISDYKF